MIPSAAGERVLVVGLGNPLMADDGFGPAVIEALRRLGFPPGVSAGVAPDVLHVRSLWRGQPAVWVVDAVKGGAAAGTVHRFDHDAVLGLPAHIGSAHHLPFGVSLRWLLHANPDLRGVRFRLWGAEPAQVLPCTGLSRRVQAAVLAVAREIRDAALREETVRAAVAEGAGVS